MQAYGNLFQGRQNAAYVTARHAFKAGFEMRVNRDTTYFGISPNGEYDFGGGTAYATEAIPSQSGSHNIQPGDALPDTLSAFLSGAPFVYTVAVAPPYSSNGAHIGPAAIGRNGINAYVQDTWKVTPTFTLDYGVRWEHYGPITERARRTSSFLTVNGVQEFVVNPQPGYEAGWKGWGPRIQASWQVSSKFSAHAGGGVTVIPPNIWQDNFLTGSTPYAIYPRLVASAKAQKPLQYGFQITPSELPQAYTPDGANILASGRSRDVKPNTVMDVDRYEKDLAALTPGYGVSDLNLSGVDRSFGDGTLYTWTAGVERKIGNLTADASYVGTAGVKLPRTSFPNGFAGAPMRRSLHTRPLMLRAQ
jgi:hypothetical protein